MRHAYTCIGAVSTTVVGMTIGLAIAASVSSDTASIATPTYPKYMEVVHDIPIVDETSACSMEVYVANQTIYPGDASLANFMHTGVLFRAIGCTSPTITPLRSLEFELKNLKFSNPLSFLVPNASLPNQWEPNSKILIHVNSWRQGITENYTWTSRQLIGTVTPAAYNVWRSRVFATRGRFAYYRIFHIVDASGLTVLPSAICWDFSVEALKMIPEFEQLNTTRVLGDAFIVHAASYETVHLGDEGAVQYFTALTNVYSAVSDHAQLFEHQFANALVTLSTGGAMYQYVPNLNRYAKITINVLKTAENLPLYHSEMYFGA
jgi:hypothetical protein